jgi:hypothetical protein
MLKKAMACQQSNLRQHKILRKEMRTEKYVKKKKQEVTSVSSYATFHQ